MFPSCIFARFDCLRWNTAKQGIGRRGILKFNKGWPHALLCVIVIPYIWDISNIPFALILYEIVLL